MGTHPPIRYNLCIRFSDFPLTAPMLLFWILAAVMTLGALAFVLVPLLRPRPAGGPSVVEANLEVLRSQRREIEADIANGTLPAEVRDEALAELVDRAQDDLQAPVAPAGAPARKPWLAAAAAGIAVPAIAFGVYLAVGTPTAVNPPVASHANGVDDKQIVAMVEALAQKVRERPDDAQGWSLLARSMGALGRFDEAVQAYEHLTKIATPDAAMLSDYADALGMSQGRSLAGRPYELARQALKLDPHYPKALALAGTAALDAGDYQAALGYWQSLAAELPAGSEDAARTEAVVQEVRDRAKAAGLALREVAPPALAAAPAAPASRAAKPAPASAVAGSVTGSVSVAPAVASKMQPGDTLFIYAQAVQGPRAPLAVVRRTAAELPLQFALDDTQSMSPAFKLSAAAAVRVEARISRSGNAVPQPGDLVGTSEVVKPGARGVKIVVDRVVP